LTERLDPRGYKLHPIKAPRPDELNRPWLFRFWLCIPAYGEIAIFDRSWYGRVLVERVEGFTPEKQWRQGYQDIVDFERGLADDGTVIIKFWLHISKKEQKRRFKRLDADPLTSWHVTEEDWEHHRKYEEYLVAVEEMMQRTDTEWGPWTIVEATSRWYARRKILETVIFRLEERLGAEAPEPVSEAELQQDMDVRLEAELRLAMEEAEHETGDNSNGEA
jgi:polyphosphate kinase 2 (PPK2 family)